MEFRVHHYEAFSPEPGKGNPAGVVLDAQGLSDVTMQMIAKQVGFNETAFVLPSTVADVRLRYFTPGHEIDLCGHATVASLFALYDRGRRSPGELVVETRAGILSMAIQLVGNKPRIEMMQAPAEFVPFRGDPATLAHILGISSSDLHPELPVVFASTGTWTLLVPVKNLRALRAMHPQSTAFPSALHQMPRSSMHPFCLEADATEADLSARHFSSPFSGTVEDPITGTASGAMGAFMAMHAESWMVDRNHSIIVEQGKDVGRDGRVHVSVTNRQPPFLVKIAGTASYVKDMGIVASADTLCDPPS
ncbi:MAG TPA: PhzF family phenazine biosynthesis isomerase [Lacipirellulaceae bacterium]